MSDVSKINGYNIKDAYSREQLADLGEKIIEVMGDVGILKNYKDQNGIDVEALKQLTSTLQESLEEANTLVEEIEKELANTKAIAKGRNRAHVFATYDDMISWLRDPSNIRVCEVGDNLYIEDTDVPDYWVTDVYDELDDTLETRIYYGISPLETQKVDLTEIISSIEQVKSDAWYMKNQINGAYRQEENGGDIVGYTEDGDAVYRTKKGFNLQGSLNDQVSHEIGCVKAWIDESQSKIRASESFDKCNLPYISVNSPWSAVAIDDSNIYIWQEATTKSYVLEVVIYYIK